MSRRSLGRGRLIIALGALVTLAGTLPAWWTVGGTVTEAYSGNAFDFPSTGIGVFLAAIGLLCVMILPYATRDGEAGLDRPLTYGLLFLLALVAFAASAYQIWDFDGLGLPDRAPGLWLTGGGLVVTAWGLAELLAERPTEY